MYLLNNFWILQRQTLQILFLIVLFYVILHYVCHSLKSVQKWFFFSGPHFPSLKLNMKWYGHFSGSVLLRKRFNPFLSSVPILYPLVFSGGYCHSLSPFSRPDLQMQWIMNPLKALRSFLWEQYKSYLAKLVLIGIEFFVIGLFFHSMPVRFFFYTCIFVLVWFFT